MSWASSEVVNVLTFLLPGFVTAFVFHSLTSHPRLKEFDRVVQALIFTILIQAIGEAILGIGRLFKAGSLWSENLEVLVLVLIAIALGTISVFVSNNDFLHRFLRRVALTRENSYPSEWYSAFHINSKCYVVLHLQGGRRLYGWPEEWPSQPEHGHFRIAEGEWLEDNKRIPMDGVVAILISVNEVEMVEFLEIEYPDDTQE